MALRGGLRTEVRNVRLRIVPYRPERERKTKVSNDGLCKNRAEGFLHRGQKQHSKKHEQKRSTPDVLFL
jgi:hypothetical protein